MKVSTSTASDMEGAVAGVPAFRCWVNPAGGWSFRCGCGRTHAHGVGEGHRAGHCATHRPHGYYLLPPVDDEADEGMA